jgi:hypothetical protein
MIERCFYCERILTKEPGDNFRTKDHIIPKSQGGRGQRGVNVVICCYQCNSIKKDYSIEFFIALIKEFGHTKGYTNEQVQRIIANANFLIVTRVNVFKNDMVKKKHEK